MTLIDLSIKADVDAKRQEAIKIIVSKIDETILLMSDSSGTINRLTKMANVILSHWATGILCFPTSESYRKEYVYLGESLEATICQIEDDYQIHQKSAKDFIVAEVAKIFAEKVVEQAKELLEKHDQNN